jgi:hypothetical protein
VKQIRKRLTYANVMSSIAVFLVLGGAAAFAASQKIGSKQLKANAVTTGKIKKAAVTTSKIKDNAVNGAKVNEGTLSTVPSASTAGFASSIPPAEATHFVGAPGEPGFNDGSHNVPGVESVKLAPVGFYKDHEGIVHLTGLAIGGNSATINSVFTLPPGYRPAASTLLLFEQFSEAELIVAGSNTSLGGQVLDGKVLVEKEGTISLDGITFRAES